MGKLGHRNQTVTNHLLLDSEGLKCIPHHIFSSEVSLLPNCSLKKTYLRAVWPCLLSPTFCRNKRSRSRRRAARQSTVFISSLFGSNLLRFLCHITYFNMSLSTLSWLSLLWVSFAEPFKLIYVSWIGLHLNYPCWLQLTDLTENGAEGVLMYI